MPTIIGCKGRIDRGDFWKLMLLAWVLMLPFAVMAELHAEPDTLAEPNWPLLLGSIVLMLFGAVILTSAEVRRLHDLGQSGWAVIAIRLLGPLGTLIWLILGCKRGDAKPNEYGRRPRTPEAPDETLPTITE